jgi:DNA polymerase III alpha subunit
METITADLSNSTTLVDRVLWYDGDSTISEEQLLRMIANGQSTVGTFVNEITPEIAKYNRFVNKDEEIGVKESIRPLSYDWNIPEEYKNLDVAEYVAAKLLESTASQPPQESVERTQRVIEELNLYEELGLMDVLKTLIFVINTLIENNVVWGVGRGSSVSSYVLYLIGVHDVDSFKYGLNIEEFLRTE